LTFETQAFGLDDEADHPVPARTGDTILTSSDDAIVHVATPALTLQNK
jgi:hypothetical protein